MTRESTYNTIPEAHVFILDSFAVLAYLQGEPSGQRVREVLSLALTGKCQLFLSLINLGEVIYIIERQHGLLEAQKVLTLLDQEPIEVVAADRESVLMAAHIKANYPLAYADAFAVAAAQSNSGIVLTGDPEFQAVEGLIEVEWLVSKPVKNIQ